nr:MAG TPA: hypothetical protein [Caudoviricetes sp.]
MLEQDLYLQQLLLGMLYTLMMQNSWRISKEVHYLVV